MLKLEVKHLSIEPDICDEMHAQCHAYHVLKETGILLHPMNFNTKLAVGHNRFDRNSQHGGCNIFSTLYRLVEEYVKRVWDQ